MSFYCRPVPTAAAPMKPKLSQQPGPPIQNPAARAQEAIKAILQERPRQLAARSLAAPPSHQLPPQAEEQQLKEEKIVRLVKMLKAQPPPKELSEEERAEIPVRLAPLCLSPANNFTHTETR